MVRSPQEMVEKLELLATINENLTAIYAQLDLDDAIKLKVNSRQGNGAQGNGTNT